MEGPCLQVRSKLLPPLLDSTVLVSLMWFSLALFCSSAFFFFFVCFLLFPFVSFFLSSFSPVLNFFHSHFWSLFWVDCLLFSVCSIRLFLCWFVWGSVSFWFVNWSMIEFRVVYFFIRKLSRNCKDLTLLIYCYKECIMLRFHLRFAK